MEREPLAPLLYTMSQTAELLSIGRTTLYKLFQQGKLTRTYIEKKPLIAFDELARYFASIKSESMSDEQ